MNLKDVRPVQLTVRFLKFLFIKVNRNIKKNICICIHFKLICGLSILIDLSHE